MLLSRMMASSRPLSTLRQEGLTLKLERARAATTHWPVLTQRLPPNLFSHVK